MTVADTVTNVERDCCKACGKTLAEHLSDRGASCQDIGGNNVKLDLRRRYFMWDGEVSLEARWTQSCTGCFEAGDYGGLSHLYPYDEKAACRIGAGCVECGYTGKRRLSAPIPARVYHANEDGI